MVGVGAGEQESLYLSVDLSERGTWRESEVVGKSLH
jgi:hypothetical protein